MKVPWYVAIIAVIGVILLTWHVRTREMNFMTPRGVNLPPEDFGEDLIVGVASLQPKIAEGPKIDLSDVPEDPVEPAIPVITDADLGDLESAPGLAEYRDFALNNTATRLIELSSTLQARGDFQRALLALERVVDTVPNPAPEELGNATEGIASLVPTLPRWNVDPEAEFPLTLNVSSSNPASEEVKLIALNLATTIRKHSGDQIQITPRITSVSNPGNVENPPLALWFSTGAEDGATTAVLTVNGDPATLEDEMTRGVFRSVRSHLSGHGYQFPPSPPDVIPQTLITGHITRLMWYDLATSLHSPQEENSE
ncbi:MAG: hypothetical protein ACSHYF_08025 [Verrucomicrobiaceae bacterium]